MPQFEKQNGGSSEQNHQTRFLNSLPAQPDNLISLEYPATERERAAQERLHRYEDRLSVIVPFTYSDDALALPNDAKSLSDILFNVGVMREDTVIGIREFITVRPGGAETGPSQSVRSTQLSALLLTSAIGEFYEPYRITPYRLRPVRVHAKDHLFALTAHTALDATIIELEERLGFDPQQASPLDQPGLAVVMKAPEASQAFQGITYSDDDVGRVSMLRKVGSQPHLNLWEPIGKVV